MLACRPGGLDSGPDETADSSSTEAPRWVWGDLHAHSRWSYDGCELPDDGCRPVGELPAEQFHAEAEAAGLDFVALTDHAEVSSWYPDGLDGPVHDIWEGQQAALAKSSGVLALLGYEWTWQTGELRDGRSVGGHRTVLLSEPAACAAARVRSPHPVTGTIEVLSDGTFYEQGDVVQVDTPGALWAALDEAAESCGLRWLTFAHHTALSSPQPTDWEVAENAPVRERLVEIVSEHGVGECALLSEEGCSWRVNTALDHVPGGAVRTALGAGFRLGFTGGTDSHDAKPGSLDDGGGPVGYWTQVTGNLEPLVLPTQGGLTGVQVTGELTREGLFDALEARATVATSGPRPELEVWIEDSAGEVRPPGAELTLQEGPFVVRVGGLEASVEVVDADGSDEVGLVTEAEPLSWTWEPEAGGWAYLRLRIGEGTEEERIWVSPWWVDEG